MAGNFTLPSYPIARTVFYLIPCVTLSRYRDNPREYPVRSRRYHEARNKINIVEVSSATRDIRAHSARESDDIHGDTENVRGVRLP